MKWSHLARLLMARKAPLLGLINQGKCLAVTHRAVLSRGSSLIAALSFMGGSLSLPSPARAANALLIRRWRLFDGGLSGARLQSENPPWPRCRLSVMMRIMLMLMKTGVCDLCRSRGLQCNVTRGQCCKQRVFTWCKRTSLIMWLL